MRLIATRQRYANGVLTPPGSAFYEDDDRKAWNLIIQGLASLPDPPKVRYETKIVQPQQPEVMADANSFRDLPVHHEKPAAVAAARYTVLSSANVQEKRTPDSVQRRKRGRPRSK